MISSALALSTYSTFQCLHTIFRANCMPENSKHVPIEEQYFWEYHIPHRNVLISFVYILYLYSAPPFNFNSISKSVSFGCLFSHNALHPKIQRAFPFPMVFSLTLLFKFELIWYQNSRCYRDYMVFFHHFQQPYPLILGIFLLLKKHVDNF